MDPLLLFLDTIPPLPREYPVSDVFNKKPVTSQIVTPINLHDNKFTDNDRWVNWGVEKVTKITIYLAMVIRLELWTSEDQDWSRGVGGGVKFRFYPVDLTD